MTKRLASIRPSQSPARECSPESRFFGLHVLGSHIVIVANKHEPWEQRHLLRVSDDDGETFRPLAFERPEGNLVQCSSVIDSRGGVVGAGFGGVVLRVAPPRSDA